MVRVVVVVVVERNENVYQRQMHLVLMCVVVLVVEVVRCIVDNGSMMYDVVDEAVERSVQCLPTVQLCTVLVFVCAEGREMVMR